MRTARRPYRSNWSDPDRLKLQLKGYQLMIEQNRERHKAEAEAEKRRWLENQEPTFQDLLKRLPRNWKL
jgi:hypothetical protein